MLAKAAIKRAQSETCFNFAEREQVRPKVNGMAVMTIMGILLFDVEKCQFLRFVAVFGRIYGISGWQSREN